ncbi:MAG TPA: beta-galactosidase trimerization domain-containing protein, partial [Roseiflexaceae bacterium]|nr:beta-galactosidase trimerization domain-containing protein [Roseiflexaceae bacterium]
GFDIPTTTDTEDPAHKAYVLWRQQRLFDLWELWDETIRAVNPEARFIPNSGGGALSELDMSVMGERCDILFADRQARRGLAPPWLNGKNAKEYRAAMGTKPIGGIFSVGIEEPYRWKDSVQHGDEIRMWVAEGTANGMRPWYTKFAGYLYDERWLPVVEEIYTWHYRNERYLRNLAPLARVAIVYSQQTAWFYGGKEAYKKVEDHTLGMYQALIEARVPFEMVHDRKLDEVGLAPFKTLILPNIAALSDEQCEQLRAFVRRGGSIVATYETSRYDERGRPRDNLGLADLFGVDVTGEAEGPLRNAYLHLEHDTQHPLLAGLNDAQHIIYGTRRLPVQARPGAKHEPPPLTL